MRIIAVALIAAVLSNAATAKKPSCAYPDGWSASIAQGQLQDAGFFRGKRIDFSKSTVSEIASEPISKGLFREVHLVRFLTTTGEAIQAITVNIAGEQECSMGGVEVYPVSKKLGTRSDSLGKPS